MKTILVAGGAGFIGSNLCDRLVREENNVICIDNFSTGKSANIRHLETDARFEMIYGDISKIDLSGLGRQIDEIYNLACPASPEAYQNDHIQTLVTCLHGSYNLLGAAYKYNAKYLLASTSEIYGDPKVHPQPETYWGNVNTYGPRSCYDEGKRAAESLCWAFMYEKRLNVRVARIFNTYGPNMDPSDGRVVSNFIVQALRGLQLTIYGDGSQTRSMCYVDDTVDGLMRLLNTNYINPINIGNDTEITILDLAHVINSMTGNKAGLCHKELPIDDPKVRKPDLTLAKKKLGYAPRVSLEKGLEKTIDYFKGVYNI